MDVDKFLNKIKQKKPKADLGLIRKAFELAERAHQGQKRESGKNFISHSIRTAEILAGWKLDSATIAAGLLHDVLDDTRISYQELKKQAGQEIADLAEGVTKVDAIRYQEQLKTTENLRKLLLATAQDIRTIIIKLADRLHNMETLSVLSPERQKRFALETLEIYAPLAYRLGMKRISGRLEDLAFPYIYPEKYQWLTNKVKIKYKDKKNFLKEIKPIVARELKKEGVNPLEIHARVKRFYSLYKKLQKYNMDLSRVYDLVALRIIVKDVEDCYKTLGIIHKLWRPLPDRIKDYISLPKPNGYQSLHTTVFCKNGEITEFQIRTRKMHQEAEYGVAAHWHYEEQKGLKSYIKRIFSRAPKKELRWISHLQNWQKELSGIPLKEFLKSLKADFLENRIFVFTPKGDVIDLPEGATAVDFAYHVHTLIGHRCSGAKADGKIISLNTPLQNKQIVEILTSKGEKPSRDWLRFVKTTLARNRIQHWFKKIEESQIKPSVSPEKEIAKKPKKIQPIKKKITKDSIEVNGGSKILTHLAKCCSPQPGDKIIGYITTTGHRITVHQASCPNFKKIKFTEKIVPVKWKT